MTKKPLVIGAQKLYLTLDGSIDFAKRLVAGLRGAPPLAEIVICPSFINLAHVAQVLKQSPVALGAQNVHQENHGAFTGMVSIDELTPLDVRYIIVGHSELRNYERETNEDVSDKVQICLRHHVSPIVCIGESAQERAAGKSEAVIRRDLEVVFGPIRDGEAIGTSVIIAYEPVWAIKGGRNDPDTKPATPEAAQGMHVFIRSVMSEMFGPDIAHDLRVIYGGSVSTGNTRELLNEADVDGLLIGSASVKMETFERILEQVADWAKAGRTQDNGFARRHDAQGSRVGPVRT